MTKEKKLSDGIRKFLAKKEEEERIKEDERKKEYDRLMETRTEKDKNKIRKMLKVTKSANRSVLADAVNSTDTALTLQGPEQPDEDDYGYTSHESSALYKNLMDKYKSIPEDKKFNDSSNRRNRNGDLMSTKDRVRAAILKDREDEQTGKKRMTTSTPTTSSSQSESEQRHRSRKNLYDPRVEREEEERRKRQEEDERRRKMKAKRPPPPIMDFNKLLELAKEKQHEPIQIEVKSPKPKEPERLLTAKEKREIEMRKAHIDEPKKNGSIKGINDNRKPEPMSNGRIPKLPSATPKPSSGLSSDNRKPVVTSSKDTMKIKPISSHSNLSKPATPRPPASMNGSRLPSTKQPAPHSDRRPVDSRSRSQETLQRNLPKQPAKLSKERPIDPKTVKPREFPPRDVVKPREFPPKDVVKPREFPPRDVVKAREFPPKDVVRSREFPPRDVTKSREFPPRDIQRNGMPMKRKPQMAQKRRILDDSDSEYDSEMDDFIDDDTEQDDYSKHIKEIFGYDKSRYRDDDDDVDNMESNFSQVQKEEFYSKKIGLMEDLEDMRLEAEEKKRKAKRQRL